VCKSSEQKAAVSPIIQLTLVEALLRDYEGVGWRMENREAGVLSHQGQKRQPDDDLESEQRLAKRFNLLNLGINPLPHMTTAS
jgi:hypothetical protein